MQNNFWLRLSHHRTNLSLDWVNEEQFLFLLLVRGDSRNWKSIPHFIDTQSGLHRISPKLLTASSYFPCWASLLQLITSYLWAPYKDQPAIFSSLQSPASHSQLSANGQSSPSSLHCLSSPSQLVATIYGLLAMYSHPFSAFIASHLIAYYRAHLQPWLWKCSHWMSVDHKESKGNWFQLIFVLTQPKV